MGERGKKMLGPIQQTMTLYHCAYKHVWLFCTSIRLTVTARCEAAKNVCQASAVDLRGGWGWIWSERKEKNGRLKNVSKVNVRMAKSKWQNSIINARDFTSKRTSVPDREREREMLIEGWKSKVVLRVRVCVCVCKCVRACVCISKCVRERQRKRWAKMVHVS